MGGRGVKISCAGGVGCHIPNQDDMDEGVVGGGHNGTCFDNGKGKDLPKVVQVGAGFGTIPPPPLPSPATAGIR